ncbi:MAG TPA: nucleotide sugar dehydrogenase [Acidimicrobiales bacterium]|nr:nucleotide sugar dehydrogenase [Acidimicrobiales bacterium]
MTRIAVFGLGYVGVMSAAALADSGHHVVGVDSNAVKVDFVNNGRTPVVEAGLGEIMARCVDSGTLRATTDPHSALEQSDLVLICVGTPSSSDGRLDLSQIEHVAAEIGTAVSVIDRPYTIVLRSTVVPGTTESVLIPALEAHSNKVAGRDFTVCYNPEFLREGTAIADYYDPPFTVIGTDSDEAADSVGCLYSMLDAPRWVTPIKVAETIKFACNAYHAIKVAFANEIGSVCKATGVDGQKVMELFAQDRKLNISDAYLRPGLAFGGSCLPKDLRAITFQARMLGVQTPLLDSVETSNRRHADRAFELIRRAEYRKIGVLGLSFKSGTDDLRESPMVELVERLIGKGYEVKVLDTSVSIARLVGANRAYIEREIPHISALMCESVAELLATNDVIVVGSTANEVDELFRLAGERHLIIDLVGSRSPRQTTCRYVGLCW